MTDVKLDTVLDNDSVNVTKVSVPAGWVGEHSHPGNQMAIVLSPVEMTYKEDGKEFTKSYDVGDVVWIDGVTHDHKTNVARTYLLVSMK
ncbi:MAG: cupin domain-containing protein [Verrucomicrobiales bacterium]